MTDGETKYLAWVVDVVAEHIAADRAACVQCVLKNDYSRARQHASGADALNRLLLRLQGHEAGPRPDPTYVQDGG